MLVWLWRNGLDIIMLAHAHGRIVTLIPIGLLSLLPVHAAGVSEDRHAGMFSAVRYAPERPHPQSLSSNRHRVRIGPLSLLVADARDEHGLPPGSHLYYADHETTEIAEIWVDAKRGRHLEHDCRWVVFRHRPTTTACGTSPATARAPSTAIDASNAAA